MARPIKTGLTYFPFDVDFFNDEKIEAISGEFGIKGEIVAIKLLTAIYRNGYFIEWSELLQMKMLKSSPSITKDLLVEIVQRLVRWNFFDEGLFNSEKILTSKGIQKRYFEAMKRNRLSDSLPFLLVSVTETRQNVAKTRQNVAKTTQRKEKENKVNVLLEKEPKYIYTSDDDFFSKTEEKDFETPCLNNQETFSKKVAAKKVFPEITEQSDLSEKEAVFTEDNYKNDVTLKETEKAAKIEGKRFDFKKALLRSGFDAELSEEWLKIRKSKKAVNSEIAFKNFIREVEKTKRNCNEILAIIVQKQWKGFEASWLENSKNQAFNNEQQPINNTEQRIGRTSISEIRRGATGWE